MNREKTKKAIEIKAINKYNNIEKYKIFLAGSIDNGNAEDWQSNMLNKINQFPVIVFNPRRENFPKNDNKELEKQVLWEMEHLSKSDCIIFYFANNTISPISLLELGAFTNKKQVFVFADDYFRKDNVRIFCEYKKISFFNNEEKMIKAIHEHLKLKTYLYS